MCGRASIEPRHDVIVFENAGYVWTVAVFGEKSLRFRKYSATCGRGLSLSVCSIERFHSIPKDTTDKEQSGHVGVRNNRLLVFYS